MDFVYTYYDLKVVHLLDTNPAIFFPIYPISTCRKNMPLWSLDMAKHDAFVH